MTAIYDGHLILKDKTIEPCCHSMQVSMITGLIYVGVQNKNPIIALRTGEKKGMKVINCPFCGAKVEVVE